MTGSFRCVAVLALVVLAAARAAEAGPISCNFGGQVDPFFPDAAYRCESVSHFFAAGTDVEQVFGFESVAPGVSAITNHLEFDQVLRDMVVTMSAFFVMPGNADFLARIPAGYEPALFGTTEGGRWVYFRVEDLSPDSGAPQQGVDFAGFWTQTIFWIAPGGAEGFEFNVLHDPRPLETFTDVITVPGSFDPDGLPSPIGPDPGIGGSADDFSDVLVVATPVPEPTTLALVLTGLIGAGLERRRRNRATRKELP